MSETRRLTTTRHKRVRRRRRGDRVIFAPVLRPVLGREQHVSPADQPRQPALFDQVAHRRDLVASAPAKFEALSYLNSRACQILLR